MKKTGVTNYSGNRACLHVSHDNKFLHQNAIQWDLKKERHVVRKQKQIKLARKQKSNA